MPYRRVFLELSRSTAVCGNLPNELPRRTCDWPEFRTRKNGWQRVPFNTTVVKNLSLTVFRFQYPRHSLKRYDVETLLIRYPGATSSVC